MDKSLAQDQLKRVARELGDFDLYDAAISADDAYKELERLFGEESTPVIDVKHDGKRGRRDTNKSQFKKNNSRRNDLKRMIPVEKNEQYKDLYEQELEILDIYGFLALADLAAHIAENKASKQESVEEKSTEEESTEEETTE